MLLTSWFELSALTAKACNLIYSLSFSLSCSVSLSSPSLPLVTLYSSGCYVPLSRRFTMIMTVMVMTGRCDASYRLDGDSLAWHQDKDMNMFFFY